MASSTDTEVWYVIEYCRADAVQDDERKGLTILKYKHLPGFPCVYRIGKRTLISEVVE
jgi:hypothetical protein